MTTSSHGGSAQGDVVGGAHKPGQARQQRRDGSGASDCDDEGAEELAGILERLQTGAYTSVLSR